MNKKKLLDAFNDDQSIDFSVDKEMLTKLDIVKTKKGEENKYDLQKIYNYQLSKDIEKIKTIKGKYVDRNNIFLSVRMEDPFYEAVATYPKLAIDGDFIHLLPYTIEESWRSSSKPYGMIAHKRYLEYLANLPRGPTDEEIREAKQREVDSNLWKEIL